MTGSLSSQFLQPIEGSPKVLVTGGNGFVGSHLADRLNKLGFDVHLLLRRTSQLTNLDGISYRGLIGDLRDTSSLGEVLQDINFIIHSGGLIKAKSLDEFMSVNRDGTANLINAAKSHCRNLKRFVYISSQSAAGPAKEHQFVTEKDAPKPLSKYGTSKLAGEEVTLSHRSEIPITIVRPPAVFGPRDTEVLTIFRFVRLGWLLKFGHLENFVSLVYVKDLVEGIIRATLAENAIGETFFLNSIDELSQWRAQEMMAEAMKVEVRPLTIPLPILRASGSLLSSIEAKLGGKPIISRDKAEELSHRYWISSSEKARSLLGYAPLFSIEDAMQETYDWYQKMRWL